MKLFHNLPIRRKMLLIILATVAVSILLTMVGIFAYELASYRNRLTRQVADSGSFIAANSAPTLAFDDPKTAREILSTLNASPEIAVAVLYSADGRPFASFVRAVQLRASLPAKPGPAGLRSSAEYLELVRPVEQKGRRLGILYVRADMALVYSRLKGYGVIILIVSLAISGGALLMQRSLQRMVSEPIMQLSGMAGKIAGGDFSARVPVSSDDEIGQLSHALNSMTVELARRSAERERLITELARSNNELQQFANVASHDLQEPLRTVRSYVELLSSRLENKLDRDSLEFMDFIVEASNRMYLLINDLLEFSRIGTRGKPFEKVDMNSVLSRALVNLDKAVRESDAEIIAEKLPSVKGDDTQLLQLMQNLLANAIKFKNVDLRPIVHISVKREAGEWMFGVKDNGIGIDPKYFERIFMVFQRLHTKEEYSGTGIGLAICKRVVERHGGRIWVESKPGEGSTFFFTLPCIDRK